MKEKLQQNPTVPEVNNSNNSITKESSGLLGFVTRHERKLAAALSIAMVIGGTGCTVTSADVNAAVRTPSGIASEDPTGGIDARYNDAISNLVNTNTTSEAAGTETKQESPTLTTTVNTTQSTETKPTSVDTTTPAATTTETQPAGGNAGTTTTQEKPVTTETSAIQKAWTYMAGKDYTDAASAGIKTQKDAKSGAIIVVSEGSKIDVTKKITGLTKDQFVYVWNNEAYVFTPNNSVSFRKYTCEIVKQDGTRAKVKLPNTLTWDYSQITWDKSLGIVFSDGYRSTYKYDSANSKWAELSEYKMYGTAEQRFKNHLKALSGGKYELNGVSYTNPLGLDATEVQSYLDKGDDSNFKSFKVVKDSAGKPAFIITINEKNGLSPEYGQIALDGFKRLNEIDPQLIRMIADRFNLAAFTRDIGGIKLFDKYPGYQGTYSAESFGSVVFFNEKSCRDLIRNITLESMKPEYAKIYLDSVLCMESRALYDQMHLVGDGSTFTTKDQLSTSVGLDKAMWFKQKVEAYYKDGKMNNFEWVRFKSYADIIYKYYGGK